MVTDVSEATPTLMPEANGHILQELGFAVRRDRDELVGRGEVVPEMHVPGTRHLRTSILAAWVDTVAGLVAVDRTSPRVPVTVELDIHLFEPAPSSGRITVVGRSLRQGRSMFVAGVEVRSGDHAIATAGASFVVSPDPAVRMPPGFTVELLGTGPRLAVPFSERAGCTRPSPGVSVLPRSEDGLNAARTVNGGLIALATEEAVLGLAPGRTLSSLDLRYLQPVRVGPLVATAELRGDLARVELRDAGNEDRLSVAATARVFGAGTWDQARSSAP